MLDPLLGTWTAQADSEMGPVTCTRTVARILDGKYVEMQTHWALEGSSYEELSLIGVGDAGSVHFWSFDSKGKRSEGVLADVTDLHPEAVGFEAQMPAGLARQAYWPHSEEGYEWVVEARTQQGWKRFVHHHYKPA